MKILVTVPVLNEQDILEKNIIKLNNFLKRKSYVYTIQIVDNGSTDRTAYIAKKLSRRFRNVDYLYLSKGGKGHAIKESWRRADKSYTILSFMDADLSTDLKDFPKLINGVVKEGYDIVIGSRHSKLSKKDWNFLRIFTSKAYIFLQKLLFRVPYDDSQCGFKAIKRLKYVKMQDDIKDDAWFFDTELLLIAIKKYNYRVKSIPVRWIERKDSKVRVFRTSLLFLKNLIRMYFYFKRQH